VSLAARAEGPQATFRQPRWSGTRHQPRAISTIGITLDLYAHVTPTMQAHAAQALDELFGRQTRSS